MKITKGKGMLFENNETYNLKESDNAGDIGGVSRRDEMYTFLGLLSLHKPELYRYISTVGDIAVQIGKYMGVTELQYYLACYYANVGLLSVDRYFESAVPLDADGKRIIMMHTLTSSEHCEKLGLKIAAELSYYHHETPGAEGAHGAQKLRYDEAYYIHVADLFVEWLLPKPYRPGYNRRIAADEALKPFANYSYVFSDKQLLDIREMLNSISLKEYGTTI